MSITSSPSALGIFPAVIAIADNDASSPQTIALNGSGILTPDFVISSPTAAQSVSSGGSAQFTVTVTAQNGATIPAVNLSATGVLPGATASFSNSIVTPGSTSATTTLTIQTSATVAASTGSAWPLAAPALALVGLFFVAGKRRRRLIALGVLMIGSLCAVSTLSGCVVVSPLPPAKSHTVTITGTIGAVQQTSTVQLTVQSRRIHANRKSRLTCAVVDYRRGLRPICICADCARGQRRLTVCSCHYRRSSSDR